MALGSAVRALRGEDLAEALPQVRDAVEADTESKVSMFDLQEAPVASALEFPVVERPEDLAQALILFEGDTGTEVGATLFSLNETAILVVGALNAGGYRVIDAATGMLLNGNSLGFSLEVYLSSMYAYGWEKTAMCRISLKPVPVSSKRSRKTASKDKEEDNGDALAPIEPAPVKEEPEPKRARKKRGKSSK